MNVEVLRMDGRQLEENIGGGQFEQRVLLFSEDGKTSAFKVDNAIVRRQQVVHLQKRQKTNQIASFHWDAVRLEFFKKGGNGNGFRQDGKNRQRVRWDAIVRIGLTVEKERSFSANEFYVRPKTAGKRFLLHGRSRRESESACIEDDVLEETIAEGVVSG